MQRYEIIGRIGNDIELKKTQSNKSVLEFSIVDNEKSGNDTITTWMNCVVWEGKAETIAKYSRKGDMIYLEGKIRNQRYEDRNGNKRNKTYLLVNNFTFLPNNRNQETVNNDLNDIANEYEWY